MEKNIFCIRLRKALSMSNMRQSELAEKGHFDKGQLSSWLSGKYRPRKSNISKLADILNVSEAWLDGYNVPMNSKLSSDEAWDEETKDFMEEVAEYEKKRMALSQQLNLLGWSFEDEDNSLPPEDENFKHYYIFRKGITSFPVSEEDFDSFLNDSETFYENRLQELFTKNKVELFPNSASKNSGLNAAHSRTDVQFTDDERAADEAMIDDNDNI